MGCAYKFADGLAPRPQFGYELVQRIFCLARYDVRHAEVSVLKLSLLSRLFVLQGDKVKRSIAGHKSMSSKFFAKVSGGMMSETPRESTSPPNTAPAVVEKKKPSAPSSSASSRLSLISAFKMPSLESVLFDTPSVSASASRHGTSSRHGLEGMSRHSARSAHGQRSAFSASKDSSELGTTVSCNSAMVAPVAISCV